VVKHERTDSVDFGSVEAATILKAYGVEPELGAVFVSLDMNVHRVVTIAGVEEKAIRPTPKDRWHPVRVYTVEPPSEQSWVYCWLTPAITRGTRRARALRVPVRAHEGRLQSKARDRPDRRVHRVVNGHLR